tara:strand:+ start:926 stop:1144 length:219 start_codon:yes stop_codon:yes gene_type:complete
MTQDYTIFTDYDHRELTVTLFTDLTASEQAWHKIADSQEWQVYQTALKYVKQHAFMEEKINSEAWPPIKLLK